MRAARSQRGVAAVEFALLAVVLLTITFGATEFGRAFYQYNTLVKATRAAAREFSFGSPVDTPGNRAEPAKCLAVYGKRPCDSKDTPLLEGLTTELVDISTLTHGTFSAGGISYDYYYFCVTIDGFEFVSLVSWVVPDIQFALIRTCMRQAA